jgi:hypothetical protein
MQLRHFPREVVRFVKNTAVTTLIRRRAVVRGRPHTLPKTLVVSLTSYAPRFPTLDLTLRSLLSGGPVTDPAPA